MRPCQRIKSHQILQIQLPFVSLIECFRLPNCHSLWTVVPGITHTLPGVSVTTKHLKINLEAVWRKNGGLRQEKNGDNWAALSVEHPAEDRKFLSPEFTIRWGTNRSHLRRWWALAVTADQWATCLHNQCWPDRMLTGCTRCAFFPADTALLLDGNRLYKYYDLKTETASPWILNSIWSVS